MSRKGIFASRSTFASTNDSPLERRKHGASCDPGSFAWIGRDFSSRLSIVRSTLVPLLQPAGCELPRSGVLRLLDVGEER